jgi:hypothetical protein
MAQPKMIGGRELYASRTLWANRYSSIKSFLVGDGLGQERNGAMAPFN